MDGAFAVELLAAFEMVPLDDEEEEASTLRGAVPPWTWSHEAQKTSSHRQDQGGSSADNIV